MKVLWLEKPQSESPLHFGKWTDPKIVVGPGKDVSWLVFWNVWIQVKELYQQKKNKANLPGYIEDFSNPNRAEHFDSIIKLRSKVSLIFPFSLQICLNIKHNIRMSNLSTIFISLFVWKKRIFVILFFLRTRVIRMMRGEKTWQWSTFSLDRRLSWVSSSMSTNIKMLQNKNTPPRLIAYTIQSLRGAFA